MKKNYLFLLSFTLFIFLSVIVKSYCDYPMWPTIVAAVTVASSFFSFADLAGVQGRAMYNISNDSLGEIDYSLFQIQHIKTTLSTLIECSAPDDKTHFSSAQDTINDLEKNYLRMQSIMKKDVRISSVLKIASVITTILGFLLLFCIMAFESLASWVIIRQDIMTVIAFGCIMLSQLLDGLVDGAREYWKNILSNLNNGLAALQKNYKSELSENAK
ncbi:MAG: hypothetical protein IK954_01315 [Clostridia bacterium]|nr:hypothetical protein [Clostridia bacterium]